jgi:urease accessory protein
MLDDISQSDAPGASLDLSRADGAVEISVAWDGERTGLKHLFQSTPCRALFPAPGHGAPFEAVLVTTSGGVLGGDRLRFDLAAGPDSTSIITTQAAEKIYRSTGPDSAITVAVHAQKNAALEWMPQETILFDGARLRRRTTLEIASGSRVLTGEIIIFGRRARGETFTKGLLHDAWRIERDGRLLWTDVLRLDGNIAEPIERVHGFDGAAAIATLLYVANDAPDRLEEARSLLSAISGCRTAATVVGPALVIRFLGRDPAALRSAYARFWGEFRAFALGAPSRLPRVWET